MKKLLTITVLMTMAVSGFAYQINYDFSAVCETGQTLYYRISSEEEHTVTLTFPYSTENPWFEGNYYQYHVMPQGELILPSTVTNNGINYYVTVIDNYAFCNCEELTGTLAIPEGIVSIGESAFFSCGFSSFVIPRTINFIDPSAFRFCSNRDSVIVDDNNPTYYSENNAIIKRDENTLVLACNTTTIPEYIENIGDYAFSGVGNGGDLIIPNSVKSIGERAFELCHFTGSLILSESLETIGYEAFRGSGLTGSLTIPNSVNEIGAGAFLSVSFTGTLTLPSSISSIKGHTFAYTNFSGILTIPNSVTQIGSMAFYRADFSELVLGSSVDTIGFGAFEDCSSLSGTLHLPSSINSIGIGAFRHTSFSELYSHNIVPPTLFNSSTFEGYDTNTPIHIPFGCTEAYQNAEGWNYFTNFIEEEPILYTDYEPDTCKFITSSHESDFMFDIDHDGTVDMTLSGYTQHGAVFVNIAMSNGFQLCRSNENTILNADTINWFQADDLSNGFPLDSYRKRFGFRKTVGEHYFYGWMEIYWDGIFVPEGKMIYLDRMAFCTIHDYALTWGQTTFNESVEEETFENVFSVYPNPTNGVLFVETLQAMSLPAKTEYRITNLMGQSLLQGHITAEKQQINIDNLRVGMYFITFAGETQKFVVE